MLRRAVDAGTALGGQVASVMSAGMLVDDALMAEVVRERLAQADVADGCILDGYPRNLLQAETLDRLLATQGRAIARVVMIEVPTEELVRRAVGRQRGADDQPEVVRERLGVYVDKTAPVADFYRQRGVLSTIDGSRPVATVTASLLAALGLASAKRG
jgi:adenylate kinase